MRNKTKKQFVKIVGPFLNGVGVFKYAIDDLVQVSIENTRGKTLAFEVMTHDKYDELEDLLYKDCQSNDARIVQRALMHFDMFEDKWGVLKMKTGELLAIIGFGIGWAILIFEGMRLY